MIKYLFFDFDGTISDAHSIAFKSLVQTLGEFEYSFDKTKAFKLLGNKMEIIFNQLGLSLEKLDPARKRFYKYFKSAALGGGIKLCVSIEPLKRLKNEKYKLIVISNSETHFIKASIKKLGIKKLFDKIYGAEKFTSKDKLLTKLFKKYKIAPSEAVYIGDRFSDVEYARRAGCIAIAIHNKCSWSTKKEILKEKPDYIIKDFRGLRAILKKENQKF
jgi:phosphoglycolate phosphatase-like HAD superfamily hydrolase